MQLAQENSRLHLAPQTLDAAAAELTRLNETTEGEFLRIGSRVSDFIVTADRISSDLSALGALISGTQGQRASQSLQDALQLSNEKSLRAAEGNGSLDELRKAAERLKQLLSQSSGAVSTFRSLGLLTRIETARLGSAGADFGSLSEDVRSLAQNVKARVQSALETSGELIPQIESAVQQVLALQRGQAQELPAVISQVLAGLSSFGDMQQRAHESSARLSGQYGQISNSFKTLIVSMQFNDIVRQQIEHVIDLLKRLSSEPALGYQDAAAILELQSLQLANAGGKFSSSVATVLRSLDEIAAHIAKMVAESGALGGFSGRENNSFFLRMENGCAAILTSLSDSANADAAIRDASAGLAEKIDKIRLSVEEMRDIEMQVRQVAINARISAVHLGEAGKALGALAEAINQQAVASRTGSDALVQTLDSMQALAANLSQRAQGVAGPDEGRLERCLAGMRTAVADLRSSHESSLTGMADIARRGVSFCEELAAARQSFCVDGPFTDIISHTRSQLAALVAQAQSSWPAAGDGTANLRLSHLAHNYTMQDQHDVHELAVNGQPGGESGAPQPASLQAGDMDENVEFF